MNEMQIFSNSEFGEIRTVTIDGEPWFVGVDIAKALGYKKPTGAVTTNVDEGDSLREGISDANGHRQTAIVINESGMYSLIFGSKLESAKRFKKWVTSEVLPSIRKTGSFNLPTTTEGQIKLLAQGNVELNKRVDEVKENVENIRADLENLKYDLPILPIEADRITVAVRKKGVEVLGGKSAPAYKDRGLRTKMYNNLYKNLKYNFGVNSYKSIKRSQCDKAVEIIKSYQPPFFLEEQIKSVNAQQSFV